MAILPQVIIPLSFCLNLVRVCVELCGLKFPVKRVEINTVFNNHFFESCFLDILLSKFGLHVFEERTRKDLDVSDLHGGQMDTPTGNNLGHLTYNLFAKHLTVLYDVVDGGVCDLVADDGARHVSQSIVCCLVVSPG